MPTRSQAASLRDHPTPGSFARPAGHGTLTVLHSSVSGGCEGDQGGSQPQGPPGLLGVSLALRARFPHCFCQRGLPALPHGGVRPRAPPQVPKSQGRSLIGPTAPEQSLGWGGWGLSHDLGWSPPTHRKQSRGARQNLRGHHCSKLSPRTAKDDINHACLA